MRNKVILVALLVFVLLLSTPSLFAKGTWAKMREWFNKKDRSTTVTGSIDSVEGRKVMFKTDDGQVLQLTGRKIDKVLENRGAVLRVFGNIQKPGGKYPTGGLDVRSFRVIREASAAPESSLEVAGITPPEPEPIAEPIPEPIPEPEPMTEPYVEPIPEPAPLEETQVEPLPMEDYPDTEKSYIVVRGDTLAKISKQMYGTTKKWKLIAEHNGIKNPKGLKVGMNLKIPTE